MAFQALNKNDNTLYPVDVWQRQFMNVTPFCPVCKQPTEIKAAASISTKTHFSHKPDSSCPLIELNHRKYSLLPPASTDITNGNKLINWVKVNPYSVYLKCRTILGGKLKFKEFTSILDKANEKRIWFYKGLTINVLPYVLIVNYGKFDKTKDLRDDNVYFIFDKELYGDDLFLQKNVTHIWKFKDNTDNNNLERVEITNITNELSEFGPDYFWSCIKSFVCK